jgi:adenylate cyclase
MAEFFAELKRRHIYRVAVAYAVVAWVLLQLFNNLTPVMKLPDWAGTLVLVLLVGGFPVALLFAWIHELAPAEGAAARVPTGRLDWVLAGALFVVIGLVTYQQFAPSRSGASQQAGVEAARAAAAKPAGISIAVLPFTNMSGDAGQEFFSDGITEEITSALAKVPDLRVVARTSAFEFKGKNVNIKTMGGELGATHLIEGSVRKAGTRVRITVQLINAADGTHIWSEDYDRQLTDVFAIQEDIARAITTSLRMPLGLKPGENLVNNRAIDPDSYQQYLRAKALVHSRGPGVTQAIDILEPLVARNSGFAPAWGLLASTYGLSTVTLGNALWSRPVEETRRLWQSASDKSEKAARESIRLDPRSAVGYANLVFVEANRKNWAAAEDFCRQALALDTNDTDTLVTYGEILERVGRVKDSLRLRQQAQALEPLVPIYNMVVAIALLLNGKADDASATLEALSPSSNPAPLRIALRARAYAAQGRYGEAADVMLTVPRNGDVTEQSLQEAARLMRSAPAKTSAPGSLPVLPAQLNFIYAYVGAPERMMDYPERALEAGNAVRFMFEPNHAPMRKTERFKAYVRTLGLVDYWKARGWPDACHPTGDDFACE